jgi:hypothetical protein
MGLGKADEEMARSQETCFAQSSCFRPGCAEGCGSNRRDDGEWFAGYEYPVVAGPHMEDTMTNSVDRQQSLIFLALAALMAVTRTSHFLTAFHNFPDASLAIFFLGGFYLRRPVFFVLLAVEAVAIDYVAINFSGVSAYCVTIAYGFLAVSYLVVWAGGMFAHRRFEKTAGFALRLAALAFVSTALGYLIANGSFYWLSGRIASPNLADYLANMTLYFPPFVGVACGYIAAAAVVHGGVLFLASSGRQSTA